MKKLLGCSSQRPPVLCRTLAIARLLTSLVCCLLLAAGPGARRAAAVGYTITDLGSLGGDRTFPYAMNNSGQVVGWSTIGPGSSPGHAFLYDAAGMHDIGGLVGDPTAFAFGINDAGQIVGQMHIGSDPSAPVHAFLYDGTTHDLGSPLSGYYSAGVAINAHGHVAVRAWAPGGTSCAGLSLRRHRNARPGHPRGLQSD